METTLVQLPEIAIIGMEGFCTPGHYAAPELWGRANARFDDVAPLGMREKDGSYVGFWGAMSDETMSFLPWTEGFTQGFYLAGLEVNRDARPPEGWTKWVMPARTYLVVDVCPERYGEIFHDVLENLLPERKLRLSGGVCDYTEPATGKSKLFFPVEPIQPGE